MWQYKDQDHLFVLWSGILFTFIGISLIALGIIHPSWLILSMVEYFRRLMINSAGFHFYFAHNSYQISNFWIIWLLIEGTMSLYGSSLQWKIVHNRHHKFSDSYMDPHQVHSWSDVFFGNYQNIIPYSISERKLLVKIPLSTIQQILHKYYWLFNLSIITLMIILFPTIALYGFLIPVGLVVLAGKIFNFKSHENNLPVDLYNYMLMGFIGEWRHAEHHKFPYKWKLGTGYKIFPWWINDLKGAFITLIRK